MRPVLALTAAVILLLGCDTERVRKLEAENQELRTRLASQDLNLQDMCAREAKKFFQESATKDDETLLLEYSNHYSRKLGKCFIEVNYNWKAFGGPFETAYISDVYEGLNILAQFQEHGSRDSHNPVVCEVNGKGCNSRSEFDEAAKYYMEQ